MFSASPLIKDIFSDKLFFFTFSLPTFNILLEMSIPTILASFIFESSIAISAVPVAMSKIFFGLSFLEIV